MHRAHKRIIDAFEGVAEHVGLALKSEWHIEGDLLRGVVTVATTGDEQDSARASLTDLVAKAQDIGTENNLTILSTLTESEVGGSVSVVLQIVSDLSLDQLVKNGKLDNYCQEFANYFEYELTKQRRPKRKQDKLPDPEKPHGAYVNQYPRLTKQFKTDVSPDLADRVEEFRKASGKTKRAIVEAALEAYLNEQAPK